MNMLARNNANGLEFAWQGALPSFESMLRRFLELEDYSQDDNSFCSGRMTMKIGEKEVLLQLPCAGCKKENFSIEIVNDFVTVKAEREKCCDEEKKEKRYIIRERSCTSFEESIKIPVAVIGSEAKAEYVNGVLRITIPREAAKKITAHSVKVEG